MQDIQQETIGHRIRLRRRELGYSQREIAGLLGFSKNHLSSIENGRTGLSLDKFVELCSILRVFPDYLLLGALHSDHIPQNIIDKLQLCSEEDVKLLEQIVELMVTAINLPGPGIRTIRRLHIMFHFGQEVFFCEL